tara:strand:+ start:3912 stop:4208 length:297 start_codon:yes stop_codon:yes gene_type:complete
LKPYDLNRPAEFLFPAADGRHDKIKLRVAVRVSMQEQEGEEQGVLSEYSMLIDNRTGTGVDVLRAEPRDNRKIRISTSGDHWFLICMETCSGMMERAP